MVGTGQDLQLGINEENLGETIMDLVEKADSASEIFSKVDIKMNSLKQYFDCSEYDSLMVSYNDFRKNYPIVKNTLVSYTDDLIAVINKIRAGDHDIALLIGDLAKDALEEAKKVEQK